MGWFLEALAVVAPEAALRRRRAQVALASLRGYDGAQNGRRTASFRTSAGSANAEIGRALVNLRERSSELVRNTWIGQRALDVLTSQVIGTDMTVRFDTGSERADERAQALWNEWTAQCDTTGDSHFNGVLALAFRAMLERGDSIIRLVDRRLGDGLRVPLQLHVAEGDAIDDSRDAASLVARGAGAGNARLGVELGEWDRRDGYWLFDRIPGEAGPLSGGGESRLVPRERVCHLYRRLRPGQVRGVPIFAPVLMTTRDYADMIDAVVVKMKMEASIGLVLKSPDAGMSLAGAVQTKADGSTERLERLRPGMVARLAPGEDAMPFIPSGNTAFDPVSRSALMGIAAGIGITYDQLTGDLTQANYSSLRAGKIEFRRLVSTLQWDLLVPMVLDRIVERFVRNAIMAGALAPRRDGYARTYVMPAPEPIDPKKDLEADILAVRAGRMSPQDFIEAWGRDWRQVLKEYTAFLKEADGAGLVFDIDARQRTRTGQDNAGAPPAAADDAA